MDKVTVDIKNEGVLRSTEGLSDLRIVSETLFGPMKLVGFWHSRQDMHLCPHMERRQDCPHSNDQNPNFVPYEKTLARERQANLAVSYPHAGITIYMS